MIMVVHSFRKLHLRLSRKRKKRAVNAFLGFSFSWSFYWEGQGHSFMCEISIFCGKKPLIFKNLSWQWPLVNHDHDYWNWVQKMSTLIKFFVFIYRGSAIAKIVGSNAKRLPQYEDRVTMWVFEEMIEGKKLTEIINETHENVKYLPNHKLPENIVSRIVFLLLYLLLSRNCL